MRKTGGLDHDHAGNAAIGMAVSQPEERRRGSLALPKAVAIPRCDRGMAVLRSRQGDFAAKLILC
jgi:hypothetical protein